MGTRGTREALRGARVKVRSPKHEAHTHTHTGGHIRPLGGHGLMRFALKRSERKSMCLWLNVSWLLWL